MKTLIARLIAAGTLAYLFSLLAVLLELWFVGETSWLGLTLLYFPHALLATPLMVLAPASLICGRRRLLWIHALCGVLVLFPLMGLRFPVRRPAKPPVASIRLLSYNVWFGARGTDAIRREVEDAQADIVLLQATNTALQKIIQGRQFDGWHSNKTSQFAVASRFPILAIEVPEDLFTDSGPPFVHYTIESNMGRLEVYNVHPISPRRGMESVIGKRHLRVFPSEAGVRAIRLNTELREKQVRGLAWSAARAGHLVVIAGDTNLPDLSLFRRRYLGSYKDAFLEAGYGFGYTYPTVTPFAWMRIDRILAGPGMRFLRVATGGSEGSDHRPVVADLALEEQRP